MPKTGVTPNTISKAVRGEKK